MKTAMAVLAMSLVLLTASMSQATEVYWTPAHDYVPQDHAGDPVRAGDLNGDGDIDISFVGCRSVHYWRIGGEGIPVWNPDASVYAGVSTCGYRATALGDLDADGDLDLAVSCYDEFLRFYRNVGTPQAPVWQYDQSMFDGVEIPPGGVSPYLTDLDADGDLDLAMANSWCFSYIQNSGTPDEPAWEEFAEIAVLGVGPYRAMALGDLDGDGDLDLVTVNYHASPQCWENVGTPESLEFAENQDMLIGVDGPAAGGCGIELLDIDSDGDPDLLVSSDSHGHFLYLNDRVTALRVTSWGRIKALYR